MIRAKYANTYEYIDNIIVCDNFLTEEEINKGLEIIKNGKWNYGHHSLGKNLYEDDFWSMDLTNDVFFSSILLKVIEKHFTLDKAMDGPDHKASLEPAELKEMVKAIRNIEFAISGSGEKEVSESEMKNIIVARKSIHLNNAMIAGQQIQKKDLVMKRPGDGISPMKIDSVIGKIVSQDLQKDHKLELKDLNN